MTCDLSPAFASGVASHLPNAKRVADRFHVMQIANRQLDLVRAKEARESEEKGRLLSRTKYVWLKREENLTPRQLVLPTKNSEGPIVYIGKPNIRTTHHDMFAQDKRQREQRRKQPHQNVRQLSPQWLPAKEANSEKFKRHKDEPNKQGSLNVQVLAEKPAGYRGKGEGSQVGKVKPRCKPRGSLPRWTFQRKLT